MDDAKEILGTAKRLGLDLDKVTHDLVEDGVKQFAKAADDLLGAVAAKRNGMLGDTLITVSSKLPEDMGKAVEKSLDDWREAGKVRQLWAHDASLWTGKDEGKWLAWLDIVADRTADLAQLKAFQEEVHQAGFTDVLLSRHGRLQPRAGGAG